MSCNLPWPNTHTFIMSLLSRAQPNSFRNVVLCVLSQVRLLYKHWQHKGNGNTDMLKEKLGARKCE